MGRGAFDSSGQTAPLRSQPVSIHPSALDEAEAAADWYSKRSLRAAAQFLTELDRMVARISEHPEQFPAYEFGARRALFRRYPYFLVFRETISRLEIIALAHARRRLERSAFLGE